MSDAKQQCFHFEIKYFILLFLSCAVMGQLHIRGDANPQRLPMQIPHPEPERTPLSSTVLVQRCRPDWEASQKKWQEAFDYWRTKSNGCYQMAFQRTCPCSKLYRGPHDVVVRNGNVNSPTGLNIPTMEEIFHLAHEKCFRKCPLSGPNYCKIRIASGSEGSYIKSFYMDWREDDIDEEIEFEILDFAFCDE